MTYLGLDYGLKHIGAAIAEGPLAQPLTSFSASSPQSHIQDLISKYHIAAIVIGIPDGPVHSQAVEFADSLARFSIPIYKVDETLSSADARQSLLHTTPSRRKSREHAAAAAVILQSWLDSTSH